jgi:hypothetical protein
MSTVAEVVEPGTEPAETPEPGDEPETTPEPTPEPEEPEEPAEEPTGALSEREVQTAMDKLAREDTRHANRISEIMGEDAQVLVKCELCAPSLSGFRFPVEPDEETKDAVRRAIGDLAAADYKASPDYYECDACGGLGRVLSGSKQADFRTVACVPCNGRGYKSRTGTVTQLPTAPDAAVQVLTEPQPAENPPTTDPWGRPLGDPLYGVMPGYEGGR